MRRVFCSGLHGHRHKTLSQFVLGTALEEAERVIRENEVVTLSGADWQVFYDALTNPPAPNAALRKAYAGTGRPMGDSGVRLAHCTVQQQGA